MTEHDIDLALANLDQPAWPSPAFAARLRSGMVSTVAAETGAKAAVPEGWEVYRNPVPAKVLTRRRLLDLAAVAALLLAMIGGLASTTQNSSAPATPTTIPAPMAELPIVQHGGTAAQDLQVTGPTPASGTPEIDWELPGGSDVGYLSMFMSGTYLNAVQYQRAAEVPSQQLIAFRSEDGRIVWEHRIDGTTDIAVTASGVVAAISPESTGATRPSAPNAPYHVALLDRNDGHAIWTSSEVFMFDQLTWSTYFVVDDSTVYVAGETGKLTAFALGDGSVRWQFSWDQTLRDGLTDEHCSSVDSGTACTRRSDIAPLMAVYGDVVYVTDQLSLRLNAIDATDGQLRWSIDLVTATDGNSFVGRFVALEAGVAVQVSKWGDESSSPNQYLGIFSADIGQRLWTSQLVVGTPLVSDGHTLYAGIIDGATYAIAAFDGTSGKIVWEWPVAAVPANPWPSAYLTDSHTLAIYNVPDNPMIGLDVDTQKVAWSVDPGESGCYFQFPGNDYGQFVCYRNGELPAVARIVPKQSASTSSVLVQTGGTGAQDQQFSGPAPSDQPYDLAWQVRTYMGISNASFAQIAGDQVITLIGESRTPHMYVAALDLATGEELWRAPASNLTTPVIDAGGVIVSVDEQDRTTPNAEIESRSIHFAKYDITTGNLIWQSASYATDGQQMIYGGIAAEHGRLYASLGAGSILALDLETGALFWQFATATKPGEGIPVDLCSPSENGEPNCFDRAPTSYIAIYGDHVYFTDFLAMTIGSINATSGTLDWQSSLGAMADPTATAPAMLVATKHGVIASLWTSNDEDQKVDRFWIGLFDAATGSNVWTKDVDYLGLPLVSDGDSVWVLIGDSNSAPNSSCCLKQIDIASGKVLWQSTELTSEFPVAWLPDANAIVVSKLNLGTTVLMDRDTHAERPMVSYATVISCSRISYPIAADGSFVCESDRTSTFIEVFKPIVVDTGSSPEASPETASTPLAINQDASGGGAVAELAPAAHLGDLVCTLNQGGCSTIERDPG